jgi:hypothetical protein
MELEEGKRYLNRNGQIIGPVHKRDEEKAYPFIYKADIYTKNGRYFNDGQESQYDLVSEYIEEKHMKIEIGKRYKTRGGKISGPVERSNGTWGKNFPFMVKIGLSTYDFTENGERLLNQKTPEDLVSLYEEDVKKEPPVKKKANKPVKYNNLRFIEAYELAKQTSKQYRFKNGDWITFPEVKIQKEQFEKAEWEVKK